ncbi:MAG: Tat pathway signal sequence domain protein [Amycolatopsis sp.]|jgi:hypothetical protein|uniref:DUF3455 domain-containing protein n=1 Tax=Amycolatopsis sp. TaxID=37632 RepID=UPI0026136368|nr:DUF3455 domain-containing protein [Amycolatopsis sp.]MCU1684661.1 Tat pathway signal sequence domain protein [Amycolatopsis sp.]
MRKLTIAATTLAMAAAIAAVDILLAQSGSAQPATGLALTHNETTPSATTSPVDVPPGQTRVADMWVETGSQVYTCTTGSWTLLEPAAVLRSGNALLLHTRGPQWISPADGSAVQGAVVASVPRTNAIPELLLKSTANRGTGLLGSVDFVQRLATQGGVAPSGSCTIGAQVAVPYSAEYRFFKPTPAPGY